MRILITGASGFLGKNLTAALEAVRDGKDRRCQDIAIEKLYLFDRDTSDQVLEEGCQKADFVFHLAGVNRSRDPADFAAGNVEFTGKLLKMLESCGNPCPVMLASSIQATCTGRYDSPYGRSKQAAEETVFAYGRKTGAKVLVYRFPNVFGKWCRPGYHSVVATFCHNYARNLPVAVTDPAIELELLYIDDLVEELLDGLRGREHRCGSYCTVPVTHRATLGDIIRWLELFRNQPGTCALLQENSFEKKLCSTYLSYLPEESVSVPLSGHRDVRGSFTELLRLNGCGQISVSVTNPGVCRGNHWHRSKWEIFWVVAGEGQVRMRRVGSTQVQTVTVRAAQPQAVYILPGYTHELINLSCEENLITVIWASESYDPENPDTFYEEVV